MENIHHGMQLKYWIHNSKVGVQHIIDALGLTGYSHIAYYYTRLEIKKETLNKFLLAMDITYEKFLTTKASNMFLNIDEYQNVLHEEQTPYIVNSTHQGLNLKTTLENKFINLSAFCDYLKISRGTLYDYFKQKELPNKIILEMCDVLEITDNLHSFWEMLVRLYRIYTKKETIQLIIITVWFCVKGVG